MNYKFFAADQDVPQEYKNGFLIMAINRAIEGQFQQLWQGMEDYPSGRFGIEVEIPASWNESNDTPPIMFKVISVYVRYKKA